MSKKLLQINTTANWGSTGKIAEEIGKLAMSEGWESWIAYGRRNATSESNIIKIGNYWESRIHSVETKLFDKQGLSSRRATKDFIKGIIQISPDIIHLHNLHGNYLNYSLLFEFLKEWGGPVVWTLHDCWSYTGHCAYYDFINCYQWQTHCSKCPQLSSYPSSFFLDRSKKNFEDKKEAFLGCLNMTLVPVSEWLKNELSKSFLSSYPIEVIHNGIDTSVFRMLKKEDKNKTQKRILGVASVWEHRKGLEEFIKLRSLLPSSYEILLVGLTKGQINTLPSGIKGIERTDSVQQLVELYNSANVFVNPTLEDNFPTTNLEALACGLPVITYNTGGSPEAIDEKTGLVVDYQNVTDLAKSIIKVCDEKPFDLNECRQRVVGMFEKKLSYSSYLKLYQSILNS